MYERFTFRPQGIALPTAGLGGELARLRTQLCLSEAELVERSPYGDKYVVRGMIQGPSGQAMEVVTVWIIMAGEAVPRLVTAFPGESE